MIQPILAAAVACALLAPSVPRAQLSLGARAALAFPFGDLQDGTKERFAVQRAYPLELSVGWRLDPSIEVGLQGGYGFVSEGKDWKDECRLAGLDCTNHLWRLAARGEYTLRDERLGLVRPFGAVTLGWEWEVQREELRSDNWTQTTWNGWVAGLEAGVDRALGSHFEAGLFAGVSFGQYRSVSVKQEIAGYSREDARGVERSALHTWLSLGLRGRFTL